METLKRHTRGKKKLSIAASILQSGEPIEYEDDLSFNLGIEYIDGVSGLFKTAHDIEEIIESLERYIRFLTKNKRNFTLSELLKAMRVPLFLFIDEWLLDTIRLYKFYSPNCDRAFAGGYDQQPAVWVEIKTMLDNIFQIRF